MADSTIPAAITALVNLFTTAAPGLQVVDSGFTEEVQDEYLAVAYPDSDDPAGDPGVTFTHDWESWGGPVLEVRESYDIRCELATWAGDGTPATRRTRIFTLYFALAAALAAAPGLSGALGGSGNALLAEGQLSDGDTPKGPAARLDFTVQVRNVIL